MEQGEDRCLIPALADVIAEHKAQLWIEHDKEQSDKRRFSPYLYQ
jgi:hypothetical protein